MRAAWWAYAALRDVRRDLASGAISGVSVLPPPRLPASSVRGVEAVLRRLAHTCLEGALVRQRWLAAHEIPREVVIGVTSAGEGFAAHAWLAGEEDPAVTGLREIARLAP